MTRSRMIATAIFAACLAGLPLSAQRAKPEPALEDVLAKVANNFHSYVDSIPNIFAEEQLTTNVISSTVTGVLASAHGTAADAIFYLRRESAPGGKSHLAESRQLKSIDHKPVGEDAKLQTPVMEIDIFSYGGSFISPPLMRCYDYKLKTNQRLQKRPVLIVEYVAKKLLARSGCPVLEVNSGRAFVDPETMQIVRMEQTRPKHPVKGMLEATRFGGYNEALNTPFNREEERESEEEPTGTWKWAVDYAPVELDGKTFWLPTTISSRTATNHTPTGVWTFVANYRNYHLLTVKSKLLPGYTVQQ